MNIYINFFLIELYKKARSGLLKEFTGIDSIYEKPLNSDLILNAGIENEYQSVQNVLQFLYEKGILPEKVFFFFLIINLKLNFLGYSKIN